MHPWKVLGGAVAVTGLAGWVATTLPVEFVPAQDQSMLLVKLQVAPGTSLAAATPLVERAERWARSQPEVGRTLTTLDGASGTMTLLLVPPGKRAATAQEFAERARQRLSGIAGLTIAVEDPSRQGFGAEQGAPIDLTLRGPDWKTLVEEATELKNRLAASGQIVDLTTDYQVGLPEVRVLPDRRRASDLGISISDLATTVNALVGGSVVGKFETGGRRVDIRARLLSSQRTRAEDISSLRIRTAEGNLVPLAMLISSSEEPALQAIRRVDRERAIRLTGNVPQGKSQADAIALVQQLAGDLPEGYRLVLGGQANQLSETASGVAFALVIGILVAYMVLASQFNSFLHPVTVLT
ncbi:MAG: efflux RND transporter permease subunit, partial [Polyangiaceae bacterium]|nr:efflux RND transporter permease subunit [Polyangiaceae bacterium]